MADVESLELQITGNAKSAKKSIDDLIRTLERLEKATAGGCGLSAVTKEVEKLKNVNIGLSSSTNTTSMSFSKMTTKIVAAGVALKKVGKTIASWITESNAYVENMNLFTVSMGEYAGAAQEYAETVGEVMGIDPSAWMRNQGVFMTLATGFGVATDRAATMSQQLTQLGYDISSFYNTSVEDAMQRLQSGVSGELEPLRRLGYDLSQAKLEATALSLGIDKAVSSMTQAEKAELRYYAIMTQVTQVQGDMARTLEAPANQMRIFQAQTEQAARALGNIFIPALNAILPYAIAVTKVLRIIADAVASLFGFTLPEMDYSSVGNVGNNVAEGFEDANKEVTKLKRTLLGIDELNVLPDKSSASSGADLGGGSFDFELPTYDFIGEATNSRVNEIVEDMKEWLGITGDITSWADLMDTKFGDMLKTVVLIGAAIASWKVASWVTTLSNSKFAEIFKDTEKLKGVGGSVMGVVGAVLQLMGAWDAWQNGLDWESLGEQLAGIGISMGGLAIAAGHIGASIASIIGGLILTITSIKDWIENGVDWDNFTGVMVGLAAVFGGISLLVGNWIPMAIGAVVATIAAIVMWWDQIAAFFTSLWDGVVSWCGEACTSIGQFFVDLWNGIVSVWNTVASWFDTNVIQPVIGFFSNLWTSVSGFFVNLWTDIVAAFSAASEWFNTNVVQPVVEYFSGLWTDVSTAASDCWSAIVEFFSPAVQWFSDLFSSIWQTLSDIFYNIGVIATGCWEIIKAAWAIAYEWFDTNVIQPLIDFFTQLWEDIKTTAVNAWNGIKTTAVNAWNGIKSVFATISTWINTNVIQPVTKFFTTLWNGIKTGAINAWNGIKSAYASIKTWISTNIIQPVGKFFTNLWNGFIDGAKSAWAGVKSVFGTVASFFKDTFQKAWAGVIKVFSVAGEIFTDIKDGIVTAFKSIVNSLIRGLNKVIKVPFDGINRALNKIRDISIFGLTPFSSLKEISIPVIPELAKGGLVDAGQLFIANEAGPELVANAGGKTAVMNNDQIVESVSQGVYRAVVQAMGQSADNQVVEAKVNDKVLFEVVVNRNRQETMRTGYNPLLGGG